jgi:hypothetical protein
MSGSDAQTRDCPESARQALIRAQSLLEEALHLIDAHADAPELGARLQEVIEGLQTRTR